MRCAYCTLPGLGVSDPIIPDSATLRFNIGILYAELFGSRTRFAVV